MSTAVAEPEAETVADAVAEQAAETVATPAKKPRKKKKTTKAAKAGTVVMKANGTPKRKPGRPSKEELARRAAEASTAKVTGSNIELIVQLHGEIKALEAKYPADLFSQFVSLK